MSDKKYYWLKLQSDFFKRNDIRVVEAMPNGKDYIIFYLKLLCESIANDGALRFSEEIPYSDGMLSTITNTNVDIVRSAINVFKELKMIEIYDDGTLFMKQVEKMVGSETKWADYKRVSRNQNKEIGQCPTNVQKQIGNCPIEIDIEKEYRNKEINKYTCMHETGYTIFMQLPLNTNESYPIYECDIDEYKKLYPNVDVEQQIRAMKGWLDANPKNRKTKNGIKRFINGWLSREQDKPKNFKNYNTEQIKAAQPTYDDSNNIQISQEEVDAFFRDRHRNL